MNPHDMQRVLAHLKRDPVVKAVYDTKSEEIGPNIFRFKAEIGAHLEYGRGACVRFQGFHKCLLLPSTQLSVAWKHAQQVWLCTHFAGN